MSQGLTRCAPTTEVAAPSPSPLERRKFAQLRCLEAFFFLSGIFFGGGPVARFLSNRRDVGGREALEMVANPTGPTHEVCHQNGLTL